MASFDEHPGADDRRLCRRWWIPSAGNDRVAGSWSDWHTQSHDRDLTRGVPRGIAGSNGRWLARRLACRIAGWQPGGC